VKGNPVLLTDQILVVQPPRPKAVDSAESEAFMKITSTASSLLALVAMAAPATMTFAADDAHDKAGVIPTPAQGIMPMIVALVVFVSVFAFLAKFVWPQITKGLADRENKIRDEIESAEMARKQAKDALEQYQQSLSQARAEAAKMIESTKAQQTALAAELKAKADVELNQMRERALRDIESAKRAAVSEIYSESAVLASHMASRILRRQVNAEDQRALLEETLSQIQSMKN